MFQNLVRLRTEQQLERARRLIQAGDIRGAEVAARNAIRGAPISAEAHHLLARSLHSQGHLNEAAASVAEAEVGDADN